MDRSGTHVFLFLGALVVEGREMKNVGRAILVALLEMALAAVLIEIVVHYV